MLKHIRLLILDLDYVVFDCTRVKVGALRQSLVSFADFIPQNIRLPDAVDVEELFRDHGSHWLRFLEVGLDEGQLVELQNAYRLEEDRLIRAGAGEIYPGLLEFLDQCRPQGVALALGAEASRDYLLSVSDHHRMDRLFQTALCNEDFGIGSSGEMLEEIMLRAEVNPSETLVLGTRPFCFRAARGLDLLTLGCGWGLEGHEGLAESDLLSLTIEGIEPALRMADDLSTRYLK